MANIQSEEKVKTPTQVPATEELTFRSIFDPRGPPPPEPILWMIPPKDFDSSKLGPLIYSSKLRKKSKQMGIYISRFYFLYEKYIGYGSSNNPSKIKKYIELDGLKIRQTEKPSKTKGTEKYAFILYRFKLSLELVTKHKDIADQWRSYLGKYCIMLDFPKFYTTKEVLGKGAHGKVLLAENMDKTQKFAVKVFDKVKILTQFRGWQNLVNEVHVLRKLKRDDIIKLQEVYESENEIHLVLEYVGGGDLHSRIRRRGIYGEKKSIALIKNLLEVVSYLHAQGLVHRDIKPANIVLSNLDSDTGIKLIDFGFAMEVEKCKDLNLRCGTPGYVAPEVLCPSMVYPICEKVDIFSIGTIFYQLLTGTKLFGGRSNRQILSANKKCIVDLTKLAKKDFSKETLDLLMKMLDRNPEVRISAEQALEHPLFANTIAIASSAEILDDDDSHINAMPHQTNPKYSFDMASLKERNLSSHSKIIDTYGTFYVIPHISLDALESVSASGGKSRQFGGKKAPRKYSENSGKGYARGGSPDSFDDSGDEEAKMDRKSPSNSFDGGPKLTRKQTFPGQSPIHKVAIMNNMKKKKIMNQESGHSIDEGNNPKEEVMPSFNLLGTSMKIS